MDYWTASRDEQTRRRFDPYHLASVDGQWYAVGYCHARQEIRTFSPGRVRSLELTDETFVVPATFDIGEYLRQSFGIMHGREGEVHHVRLRFRGDAVHYIRERTWHASQILETTAEGDLIVALEVSPSARWSGGPCRGRRTARSCSRPSSASKWPTPCARRWASHSRRGGTTLTHRLQQSQMSTRCPPRLKPATTTGPRTATCARPRETPSSANGARATRAGHRRARTRANRPGGPPR